MNKFTEEEIKTAKEVKRVIIEEDVEELKAVYMAGEICMWEEMQQGKNLNIPYIIKAEGDSVCEHPFHKLIQTLDGFNCECGKQLYP